MMKTEKELLAEIILEARDLMNDGGKHWIKGIFEEYDPETGEKSYCTVGALYVCFLNRNIPFYVYDDISLQLVQTISEYSGWHGESVISCLSRFSITSWNDAPERTWEDVERVLTETARRLRDG